MNGEIRPTDAEAVRDAVQGALAKDSSLEVAGGGSRRAVGRPVQAGAVLDLSGLTGITLYEPEELVLAARAGTTVAEIVAALDANRQQLAFEPADWAPLLGGTAGMQTIGGILASNLSGPRRIRAGAARDHFLGFSAVSGRGEAFKAGGRVVKNVTGYDLCKLLAGSWGTLAVLTSVTVKVMPAPAGARTLLLAGLSAGAAVRAMTDALGSVHDVSGAAWLPAGLAAGSAVAAVAGAAAAVAALRIEGFGPSVEFRCKALADLVGPADGVVFLEGADSAVLWREIRDVRPFHGDTAPVWRLSVPPTAGPGVIDAIARTLDAEAFLDWGGGLVWLRLRDGASPDAGAAVVRAALVDCGGHATLVRASTVVRAAIPVFQPEAAGLAALSARVRDSFDPARVLNPGRMVAAG